jgi:hypothetical protein
MSELFRLGQDLWSFLPLPGLGAPSVHDLYLSPHLDDVCFSLGSYVASRGKGTLLNVFTHSNCIQHHDTIGTQRLDELPPEARSMLVTTIRREEDSHFIDKAGLQAAYCNFDEAPIRGHEPFDPACVREDTDRFSPAIMDHIKTLRLGTDERTTTLYCPLGIGGHVDHLIVRNTVLGNLTELRALYRVCFYEDLPYAANPAARQAGLHDFFERVRPAQPWRHALRVRNLRYKQELLEIYKSQFRWLPAVIGEFTPATRVPHNPVHEALWVL